jgi:Holliday junction DNA helicase RuvA
MKTATFGRLRSGASAARSGQVEGSAARASRVRADSKALNLRQEADDAGWAPWRWFDFEAGGSEAVKAKADRRSWGGWMVIESYSATAVSQDTGEELGAAFGRGPILSATGDGWGTIHSMIVWLSGTWRNSYLDVNGVGYDVEVVVEPPVGTQVDLYIRSIWREASGYSLYGFTQEAERECFDAMCKVNRVGPTAAMSVLRTHGLGRTCASILAKDPGMLAKTPGVGRKTAELIVGYTKLEPRLEELAQENGVQPDDVVDALVALGYEEKAARAAAKQARESGVDGEEALREALRLVRGQ